MTQLIVHIGLWYLGDCLIVPNGCGVPEENFHMAYDTLGHFGFSKTYDLICSSYFWPSMHKDLEEGYIFSCLECQWNKSSTNKPSEPLHLLPILDDRCQSIALDFISPLSEDKGYNCILTRTDHLNSEFHLISTWTDIIAKELAFIFFDKWYCESDLPLQLISDCDNYSCHAFSII